MFTRVAREVRPDFRCRSPLAYHSLAALRLTKAVSFHVRFVCVCAFCSHKTCINARGDRFRESLSFAACKHIIVSFEFAVNVFSRATRLLRRICSRNARRRAYLIQMLFPGDFCLKQLEQLVLRGTCACHARVSRKLIALASRARKLKIILLLLKGFV